MFAKNCSIDNLNDALNVVNKKYGCNICFKNISPAGKKHSRFTLRVKSSRAAGAAVSWRGRRSISACWHVHGHFFDALLEINPAAIIVSSWGQNGKRIISREGGNWQDAQIGSIMQPCYQSQACNCQ